MTTEEKLKLVRQVGEEIIEESELLRLFENDREIIAYDGFEPSGQIHIAQGLLRAININKLTKAGIRFKMLVADWHAMANNKIGGDLDKIQTVGKYFIEVWKACGLDTTKVDFIWASDLAKNPNYWKLVVQVGRTNALRRFIRTAEMMGRTESLDMLTGANIIYSCMQVADIFTLGAKIAQLGADQRKLNMLAREIGPQLGFWKPVVVSHHMLLGLGKPPADKTNSTSRAIAMKMSKSNPENAIFMTDTTADIERKINKAYCPEGKTTENPVLEYCRYIIFESLERLSTKEFVIERPDKWGGTLRLKTYKELEKIFSEKKLHPQDLKQAVINYLDRLIQPVRQHFENDQSAKNLLEKVKNFQVTR